MCAEWRTSLGAACRYFGGRVGVSIAKVMASELQWRWREAEQNYAGGRTCRTCSVRGPYYKRRVVS